MKQNKALSAGGLTIAVIGLFSALAFSQPAIADEASDVVNVTNNLGESTTIPITSGPAVEPSSPGTGNLSELVGEADLSEIDLETPRIDATTGANGVPQPPSSRVVIGTDNRTAVSNVSASPYSQIPLLLYKSGSEDYMCSGALVGDYTVVTAAHCLYSGTNGWSTEVAVLFSVSGTSASFGCYPSTMTVSNDWINSQGNPDDWGVIKLACNAGSVAGHMGYRDAGTGAVSGSNWFITGYPGDKVTASGYSMWQASGSLNSYSSKQFSYSIDTAGGQSGAPIWRLESGTACGNCVIGVHTAGSSSSQINVGTRLTGGFKAALDSLQ